MYQPTDIAVYIHWPYCKSKCPYCDFYKELYHHVDQDALTDEYLKALNRYHELTAGRTVKSIFFGGGTPSLMKPQNVARIIDFIAEKWPLHTDAEISLEANPNSDYPTMFTDLKNAGINRLSLGVQALNDNDLRFLGRTHNLTEARHCLQEITRVFNNHSADLIYARPHQQPDAWQQELKEIVSYGLQHISLYQLTIEEGTVFARKNIQPLPDEDALSMYRTTCDFLAAHHYEHYEVSNFAKPNFESVHNLTYWQGGDYIGIGKSAHGRLFLQNRHIATVYPFNHEPLTASERAEELIIMGMRLTAGINLARFKQICGLDFEDCINCENLTELCDLGLLVKDQTTVRATAEGFVLLNEIIRRLCA